MRGWTLWSDHGPWALVHLAVAERAITLQQVELPVQALFRVKGRGPVPVPSLLQQVRLGRMLQRVVVAQRMTLADRQDALPHPLRG